MERDIILDILNSWNLWKHNIDTGIERSFYVEEIIKLLGPEIPIVVETGIRRAGKSYIARQVAKKLIEKGYQKERILIFNLEDERLLEKNYNTLLEMYKVYKEEINPKQSSIIIIDEAQSIDGWERFVRGLSERGEARFIVTGSSSKLLDSEYSTLLSGRHVVVYVQPLNLVEYFMFAKNSNVGNYIKEGGFPAMALSNNKIELARSYFDTIILKDVIQRFMVKKQDELIRLAKFYITSVGSKITFNSVSKFLKLPVKTIYNFSHYLENAYLIFLIDRFSFSIKAQNNSPKKVYCIDNAFPSILGLNALEIRGRLLENSVAAMLYMISRHMQNFNIYYWYEGNHEVDFIIRENQHYEILQVAYSVKKEETRTREVTAILDCAKRLNLNDATVVTMDYASEEILNGVTIKYVPVEEWMKTTLKKYGYVK